MRAGKKIQKPLTGSSCLLGFAELAKVTGLPETTVKNWTFGRPLRISACRSIGRRNLYSEVEAFQFYVAKQMVEFGFVPGGELQKIIDQIDAKVVSRIGDSIVGMIVRAGKKGREVEFYGDAPLMENLAIGGVFVLELWPFAVQLAKHVISTSR